MRKILTGSLLAVGMVIAAQNPDNTKANKRDRDAAAATADDQGQSKEDIELTRKIRKQLTSDETLSTYAKNVKVIAKDGVVTLRGPVRSAEERSKVEQIARTAAGDAKVTSELEVATNK